MIAELNGNVPTYAAKTAAERDAYFASNVTTVVNNLKVNFPITKNVPSDTEIAANVVNKLKWNSQIGDAGINVRTSDGIVVLSGVVNSYWEKNLAEDLALYSDGVIEVINDLGVTPLKSIIDFDIENDIKNAFIRNSIIDETKINVSVSGGVVTLSGIASSYFVKTRAYHIAMYTAGVRDVKDNIIIA